MVKQEDYRESYWRKEVVGCTTTREQQQQTVLWGKRERSLAKKDHQLIQKTQSSTSAATKGNLGSGGGFGGAKRIKTMWVL